MLSLGTGMSHPEDSVQQTHINVSPAWMQYQPGPSAYQPNSERLPYLAPGMSYPDDDDPRTFMGVPLAPTHFLTSSSVCQPNAGPMLSLGKGNSHPDCSVQPRRMKLSLAQREPSPPIYAELRTAVPTPDAMQHKSKPAKVYDYVRGQAKKGADAAAKGAGAVVKGAGAVAKGAGALAKGAGAMVKGAGVAVKGAVTGTSAVLQRDPDVKEDFHQAAKHILQELTGINAMCASYIVDPQAIQKVMEQLNQNAACICIAGRYNIGKSTLINALLGSRILPTSRDGETAVTVYVTIPATNDVTENNPPHLYPWPANGTERPICSGVDAINKRLQQENLSVRSQSGTQERVFVVKTAIPMFSELSNLGVGLTPYLVDLPGSNEACQEKLTKVSKLNVETATAFLYVMTYSDLKNNQDLDAIKAIYNKDRQVFNDGRLTIVVTKFDDSYGCSNDKELSVEEVQEKVAELIFDALNLLEPLSKELIIPISGLWAFLARLEPLSEDGKHREIVNTHLIKLLKIATLEKLQEVYKLSDEEASSRLEDASRIAQLEKLMKEVTLSMITTWKRAIAMSCEGFIHTTRTHLDEMHQSVDSEHNEINQMLKNAHELHTLHQKILHTLQEGSEFLKDLRKCYNEDTKPGDKLSERINDLVTTFIAQVKQIKKERNYLPDHLERDVQDVFRVRAEKEMRDFFRGVKYDSCIEELNQAIFKMAIYCGSLRKLVGVFAHKEEESLPTISKGDGLKQTLDDAVEDSDDTLEHIDVPPVEMTIGKWVKLVISYATLKLKKFSFIKDEDLKDLEDHLRRDLREYYISHFKRIKDQVIQYYFQIYCSKTQLSLAAFQQLMADGDVESKISEYKEREAVLSQELDKLEHWRSQTLPGLSGKLKLLGL